MGIINWLLAPFTESFETPIQVEAIQPESLQNESELVSRDPTKSLLFRPNTWEQYIGQEKAKARLQSIIAGVKERKQILGHILIYGPAGTGKTTLAKLIAHELGSPLKEVMTGTIQEFWKLESLIRDSGGQVLFLDEIHALDRATAEKIYTIMEDFSLNGKPVDRFTLVGATTEIGEIIEKITPFYDRFEIKIELEPYSLQELILILSQYSKIIFPSDVINKFWYNQIAENCRGVPREAQHLLKESIFTGDVKRVLYNQGIIHKGFNLRDLKALEYIGSCDSGAGLQSISSFLGTSSKNYMNKIEPFILQSQAIVRTARGRKITQKGCDLINFLKKEAKKKGLV